MLARGSSALPASLPDASDASHDDEAQPSSRMSPIRFMIAAFSLYGDFWCGVGFMPAKVAHDQPLVHMFMLWSVS